MSSAQALLQRPGAHRRRLAGSAALVLAGLSAAAFWLDLEPRRGAVSLLRAVGIASASGTLDTLRVLESGDLAVAFAVEAALSEIAPGGSAAGASARYGPRARGMLATAVGLSASSVAARPGSAFDRLLLGRAVYAQWDLEASPPPGRADAWQVAFREAARGAPGFELLAVSAGAASLAAWPRLSPSQQESASAAIRGGLQSRDFVRRAFPGAWRLLGPGAIGLLPQNAEALAEAEALLRAMGESGPADQVEARRTSLPAR